MKFCKDCQSQLRDDGTHYYYTHCVETYIQNSTSNAKIQALIDKHKFDRCGCDRLDGETNAIILVLEQLIGSE